MNSKDIMGTNVEVGFLLFLRDFNCCKINVKGQLDLFPLRKQYYYSVNASSTDSTPPCTLKSHLENIYTTNTIPI